jgi:hypothetical protein
MAQMRNRLMRIPHIWVFAQAPVPYVIHKTLNTSERALECNGEEPDAVHAAAARGGDHRRQEAQDTQDHQLDKAGAQPSLLRISIKVMRIRLLTLMRIGMRFRIFTLIRIRDLLIIKVIRINDQCHTYSSTAPF